MKIFPLGILQTPGARYWNIGAIPTEVQQEVIREVDRVRTSLGNKVGGVHFRSTVRTNTVNIIFETMQETYNFEIADTLSELYFTIMDKDLPIEHKVTQRPFGGAHW